MAGENAQTRCSPTQLYEERVTVVGAKTKGDVDVIQDVVGYYLNDIAAAGIGPFCFEASRVIFPKTAGLAIAQFQRVYWNDNNKVVTLTNTDYAIGWCIRAAAGGDSTVWFCLRNEVESTTY